MYFTITAILSVDSTPQGLDGHAWRVATVLDGMGRKSGLLTTVLYCLCPSCVRTKPDVEDTKTNQAQSLQGTHGLFRKIHRT